MALQIDIYGLADPDTFLYFYVGQTRGELETRLRAHIQRSYPDNPHHRENHAKSLAICEIIRRGKRPIITSLAHTSDQREANELESRWVGKLRKQGHPIVNRGGFNLVPVVKERGQKVLTSVTLSAEQRQLFQCWAECHSHTLTSAVRFAIGRLLEQEAQNNGRQTDQRPPDGRSAETLVPAD